ncbi:MAG TPA: AraC family transcriptional regulator [Flavobacteriaceae bacterium]|nr:AraC family transcriptional regulator [Flavobacteriaceae bacterium]
MKNTALSNCVIHPEISAEQFVEKHTFVFLVKGLINGFDGNKTYPLKAGECCVVVKNHLQRHNKQWVNDEFEKIVIEFEDEFLLKFKKKYNPEIGRNQNKSTFICLPKSELFTSFILSLIPYYKGHNELEPKYELIKKEELLMLLLDIKPELNAILFDFGMPQKIDIESFMQRNYRFNVSVEKMAFLTGRSLSSFKRDFKDVFDSTPVKWLVQRRLEEAHFLLEKKKQKPSEIYLDLGFEDLSHFTYAFRKKYGYTPATVAK